MENWGMTPSLAITVALGGLSILALSSIAILR
jgi:hypothetical protein